MAHVPREPRLPHSLDRVEYLCGALHENRALFSQLQNYRAALEAKEEGRIGAEQLRSACLPELSRQRTRLGVGVELCYQWKLKDGIEGLDHGWDAKPDLGLMAVAV